LIKDIILPEIGEGIDSVEISEISVKSGDKIAIDDVILVLESEKATMEIPTTIAGTVEKVLVKAGDAVSPGTLVMTIDVGEKEISPEVVKETDPLPENGIVCTLPKKANAPAEEPRENSHDPAQHQTTPVPVETNLPLASPSVRKFARELGCDIHLVKGAGTKNRITKQDVQEFVKRALSGVPTGVPMGRPAVDFSRWGEIETQPLNRIRRLTGEHMSRSWTTIPHVTQYEKTDITDLLNFTRLLGKTSGQRSGKLSLLPFVIKALVQTLKDFPDFNSSLDPSGENLILKKYYNIGIAVDTPGGLVVPVINNADQLDLGALNSALTDFGERARGKKLKPDELQGSTFTITSLGGIGGTYFSPIVNSPEVAILGISKYSVEPVFREGHFVPRTLLPFSLSYDHRVIDGAWAARFTGQLGKLLNHFTDIEGLNLL